METLDYVLIVLPVALLLLWILMFVIRRYMGILLASILLIIFDLPHIFTAFAILRGAGAFGISTFTVPIILGILFFLLGIFGIVYSVQGIRSGIY
jgi:hypothetical protein